jgi:hypothetical protein
VSLGLPGGIREDFLEEDEERRKQRMAEQEIPDLENSTRNA